MADPVIEARDVYRTYEVSRGIFAPPGHVKAVAGVSLAVERGKTLAIVGESGSGKSTLSRLLTLIEKPTSGTVHIEGVDVTQAAGAQKKALRQKVQMVFQNPYGSLNPRQTVGDTLEEPLAVNTDTPATERRRRVAEMLERVGLRPEHAGRYPHMFSGGQRQRIAIARALMLNPDIVILDEPVSALDVSVRAQVLNLLMDLQEEFRLAYIFVSHDLSVVKHIADDILVLYLGQAVETGKSADVFAEPLHPYTKALMSATPYADPTRARQRQVLTGEMPSPFAPPPGCVFHPRCPIAEADCARIIPELKGTHGRQTACLLVDPDKATVGEPA